MFVLKRIAILIIVISLVVAVVPQPVHSSGEAYVVGSIKGTHREVSGYFNRHPYLLSRSEDEVEFIGFRLVDVNSGDTFLIRPNRHGYFYQALPGGEYTLSRKRSDRPSYKEPKTIDILRFKVEPGTLANLGTIGIILDGEPGEFIYSLGGHERERGKYTYRYSYLREKGNESYEKPLNWFRTRRSKTAAGLGDRIFNVDANTTTEKDGSEVVIEIHRRRGND